MHVCVDANLSRIKLIKEFKWPLIAMWNKGTTAINHNSQVVKLSENQVKGDSHLHYTAIHSACCIQSTVDGDTEGDWQQACQSHHNKIENPQNRNTKSERDIMIDEIKITRKPFELWPNSLLGILGSLQFPT